MTTTLLAQIVGGLLLFLGIVVELVLDMSNGVPTDRKVQVHILTALYALAFIMAFR